MHETSRHAVARRIAAPIVVAGLLAGCGAGATPTPPPDPTALLTSSAEATSKLSGPLDLAITFDGKIVESGKTTELSGSKITAAFDRDGKQADVNVTIKGVEASGDFTAALRVVNDTAYVQAAMLGPSWYSLPLSTAESLMPSAAPEASMDPKTVLDPLTKDSGVKITYAGTEQLDGRDQHKITVTVTGASASKFLSEASSLTGGAAPLPSMEAVPDVTVNVWIDRQSGAFSKATTTISDTAGSSLSIAVTLKAHSGSLSVQAPPADQVQPAEQLLQMFMGLSGSGGNPFGDLFGTPAP